MKILLVDPDKTTLRVNHDLLESMGHNVSILKGGAKIISTLIRDKFDLLLTEINLPVQNGLFLLDQIKGMFPDLPIIVLTEGFSTYTAGEMVKRAINQILLKPASPETLESAFYDAVSRPHVWQNKTIYTVDEHFSEAALAV